MSAMPKLIRGFTLIELLIVVAIIAILAAIAVPNFLEAQTRAKVAKVRGDMRSIVTVLETYMCDNNNYPEIPRGVGWSLIESCSQLTTPIAYMTSTMILDPFISKTRENGDGNFLPDSMIGSYRYFPYNGWWVKQCHSGFIRKGYVLNSFGPCSQANYSEHIPYIILKDPNWRPVGKAPWYTGVINHPYDMIYDPTNGTRSVGDIPRFGGDLRTAIGYSG